MFNIIFQPTVYIPAIFILLIIIFALIFAKDAKKHPHTTTKNLPYYDEIELSAGYISRNILLDGRFVYRNNVYPNIKYENNLYNSLRHAGVLYSLWLYEKLGLENRYYNQRLLASKYFADRYVKQLGETNKYMVISIPEEERLNIPIAKSGAAGIALCALSNLYEKEEIDIEILRGLGEFLLYMQAENGNIYAYYDLDKNEINKDAEAIYYPGEAAAGLMSLYEADKQQKWAEAAKKAVLYLQKNSLNGNNEPFFDHWAVFAVEKLLKTNFISDEEREILRDYAEKMAIPMLSAQITNKKHLYYGAWKDNIIPSSIGTIMEGLASIYFCTEDKKLKTVIYKSLVCGCRFLGKAQVKTGINAGGIPNSADWTTPGSSPNASVIRIDNVQHAICAWLKFQQIIND